MADGFNILGLAVSSEHQHKGIGKQLLQTVEAEAVTSDVAENEALPTVQTFDIAVESAKIKNELADSAEVDALVSKIELDNLDSIVTFGGEVATEISKSSDLVLNSMNIAQIEETSKMLGVLTNIMSKFDIEEIRQEPGLFDKLFDNLVLFCSLFFDVQLPLLRDDGQIVHHPFLIPFIILTRIALLQDMTKTPCHDVLSTAAFNAAIFRNTFPKVFGNSATKTRFFCDK